jgi:hypothetical protein
MAPEVRPRGRRNGERHATTRRTEDDAQVSDPSHRDVARLVREADRFALQLPVVGRVPIPRPDQLAFHGALAGLVAAELVDWPVAQAISSLCSSPTPRRPRGDPMAPALANAIARCGAFDAGRGD